MSAARRRRERLHELERRLAGPKRLALFGHRAVGKTTLLAMFYREASSGRVPGLRLAASDTATADYLGARIQRLESGEPPAGTLSETELRLRLYHNRAQMPLIVRDYQGEHVELESDAPIRAFFAGCDAVFLCLDGTTGTSHADRLRRQQEVEALLERYLDNSVDGTTERPLALLITKYDQVIASGGPPPDQVEQLAESLYGMTRHALAQHVPRSAIFAVSSYGHASVDGKPPSELHPLGLEAPLLWLAEQLEAIDHEEIQWIWDLAPHDLGRLSRCVSVFSHRYPQSARLPLYRAGLEALASRRRKSRLKQVASAAGGILLALALYDLWGFTAARALERTNGSAVAMEKRWNDFLAWHPTQGLFFPWQRRQAREHLRSWTLKAAAERVAAGTAASEAELAKTLDTIRAEDPRLAPEIEAVTAAQARKREEAEWKRLTAGGLEPAAELAGLRKFLRDYPDTSQRAAAESRVRTLESEQLAQQSLSDKQELEALQRELALPDPDLESVVDQARRFLDTRPNSPLHPEVQGLLDRTVRRIEERAIEDARNFSRNFPTNFATRRRKYEEYLKAHPQGGPFVREALDALGRIDRERDDYTYRKAFDHAQAYPDDLPVVARLLQSYLDTVPDGRYAGAAREYLKWWQGIQQPKDYHVTLLRGKVETSVGKYLSGGAPDLAVELWVGGVKYGPSSVAPNSHDPIWNYTFPKPIRWKMGDAVVIRIVDTDWSTSGTGVFQIVSRKGDPLAIRHISGPVRPATGGRTELVFRSDFKVPPLPRPGG